MVRASVLYIIWCSVGGRCLLLSIILCIGFCWTLFCENPCIHYMCMSAQVLVMSDHSLAWSDIMSDQTKRIIMHTGHIIIFELGPWNQFLRIQLPLNQLQIDYLTGSTPIKSTPMKSSVIYCTVSRYTCSLLATCSYVNVRIQSTQRDYASHTFS